MGYARGVVTDGPVPNAPTPRRRRRRRMIVRGILGLGLDGSDGHVRVTKGKDFLLLGGSHETHEHMQEFAVKLNERLKERGKSLGQVSPRELRRLADDL